MGMRMQIGKWAWALLTPLFAIVSCGGGGSNAATGAPNDLVGTWNGEMNGPGGSATYLTLQISASGSISGSVQMGTDTAGQFYGSGVFFQESGTMQKSGNFAISGTSTTGGAMSISGNLAVAGGASYTVIAGGSGQENLNGTGSSVTFSLDSTNSVE